MNRFFSLLNLLLVLALAPVSCSKKDVKEHRMENFVRTMNGPHELIENESVQFVNAQKTGTDNITLNFKTRLPEEQLQSDLLRSSVFDLAAKIISRNKKNMLLVKRGVRFNVRLMNEKGKLIGADVLSRNGFSSGNTAPSHEEKHAQVNQMLEVFSGKLPVTDSVSGVRITRIELGSNNNIVYTNEVPDKIRDAIARPESKELIRKNMLADPKLKDMLKNFRNLDIFSLKYQYRDRKGKLLQEVEVREKDFKP